MSELHGSKHHIISTSRGGPKEPWNTYQWKQSKHRAWNQLFHNLLPSEVISLIEENWMTETGDLDLKKMGKSNLRTWKKLFGELSAQGAIEFIKKNFLLAERRFFKERDSSK